MMTLQRQDFEESYTLHSVTKGLQKKDISGAVMYGLFNLKDDRDREEVTVEMMMSIAILIQLERGLNFKLKFTPTILS